SVFSRSSATVLKLFTGSDDFTFFSTVILRCDVNYFGTDFTRCFGRVEPGIPGVDTTISFATFSDAANQAGLSRLYGGIHFVDDNTSGQAIGLLLAQQAWAKAQMLFNGTTPRRRAPPCALSSFRRSPSRHSSEAPHRRPV